MARDKKTESYKNIDTNDLPDLSPQVIDFIEYYMFDPSVDGNATEAYRRAFPDSKANKNTTWKEASLLINSPKVSPWIQALRQANLDRLECSKGEHLSELAKLRDEAKSTGNYGAAVQAELSRGKVAGHYIDRKEITHKRQDDLAILKDIARDGTKESIAFALKEAKALGLEKELQKHLGAVH